MFDVSFFELLIVATVALLVLGPEEMMKLMKFMGRVFAKIRRFTSSISAEIDFENYRDEIKRAQEIIKKSGNSATDSDSAAYSLNKDRPDGKNE